MQSSEFVRIKFNETKYKDLEIVGYTWELSRLFQMIT